MSQRSGSRFGRLWRVAGAERISMPRRIGCVGPSDIARANSRAVRCEPAVAARCLTLLPEPAEHDRAEPAALPNAICDHLHFGLVLNPPSFRTGLNKPISIFAGVRPPHRSRTDARGFAIGEAPSWRFYCHHLPRFYGIRAQVDQAFLQRGDLRFQSNDTPEEAGIGQAGSWRATLSLRTKRANLGLSTAIE